MELDKDDYYILGMLRTGARERYEVKLASEFYSHSFWSIQHAELEPRIERLEQAGMVARHATKEGWPWTAWTVTPAGERALRQALTSDDLELSLRHEGLLRLLLAELLDEGERSALLDAVRRDHGRARDRLERVRPAVERSCAQSGNRFPMLAIDASIEIEAFFVDLCERLGRELGGDRL